MRVISLLRLLPALVFFFLALSPTYAVGQNATGSLLVTISPEAVNDAGARWKVVGEDTLHRSGDTVINIEVGTVLVEFSDVTGWIKPPTQPVVIEEDRTTTLSVAYERAGSLQVRIEPEAVPEPGWRIAGTLCDPEEGRIWCTRGETLPSVRPGRYDIEFKDVPGWVRPANQTVTVVAGRTTFATGRYVLGGSLQVVIEPEAVRNAPPNDPGWRIVGSMCGPERMWCASGETISGLQPGPHVIEFKSVPGWVSPANQTVTIITGRTTFATGRYVLGGSLQVRIEPGAVLSNDPGWRIVGSMCTPEELWCASGETVTGLRPGTHVIEFATVPGWVRPPNQTVTIVTGRTAFATGTYVLATDRGRIQIFLNPGEAGNMGARWRRTGTSGWLASGGIEGGLPEGTYSIEFRSIVPLGVAPSPITVHVRRGGLTRFTANYSLAQGLGVVIEPAAAREAGAMWRRVGTREWRTSGERVRLPPGIYAVEFSPVPNWRLPAERQVMVRNRALTQVSALYTVPQGLRVLVEPAEARQAGAQWRRVGTQIWRNSGGMERLPAGVHAIEFKPIRNWNHPPERRVVVRANQMTSLAAEYTIPQGLRVMILPEEAARQGARWRRVGTQVWRTSGAMERLAIGQYAVEFKPVGNWRSPPPRRVEIMDLRMTTVHALYTVPQGLRVLIEPVAARQAGARWRRVGTETWRPHGYMERLPAGPYWVEFLAPPGWRLPATIPTTVQPGGLRTVDGRYVRQ